MPPIVSQEVIRRMFKDATNEMSEEDAMLHVAGVTGHEVTTIESVLWTAESRHTAVMEAA